MHGITTDNNKGQQLEFIFKQEKVDEATRQDIETLANIKDIKNEDIFIITRKNDSVEDKVLTFSDTDKKITTYNIAGFIGVNDTSLSIMSRFAIAEDPDQDYFLHYILSKVLNFDVVKLEHSINDDNIFDFRIYMFKHYFQKALATGIYKQYMKYEYNDSKVKGTIDFARHIKYNFMYNGNVAYSTREYSYNNPLNQLIRHTIEYIKEKNYSFIFEDKETKELIRKIEEITPTYSKHNRYYIINKNLKPHNHPLYTEYEPLRKLCIQILRHEKLKYGMGKDKVYGILFDIYYLWEEYIATILSKDLGFKHPENRNRKGGIKILSNSNLPGGNWVCLPDFYNDNDKIVIDTKYKRLKNIVDEEDRYQILSYMYILGSKNGFLLHPAENNRECQLSNLNTEYNKQLKGHSIGIYPFYIPQNVSDIKDFSEKIKKLEDKLKNFVLNKEYKNNE